MIVISAGGVRQFDDDIVTLSCQWLSSIAFKPQTERKPKKFLSLFFLREGREVITLTDFKTDNSSSSVRTSL